VALICEITYLACTMELCISKRKWSGCLCAYRRFRKTRNKIKSFEDWLL